MSIVIVDVRTTKEFQEGAYPGAINRPSKVFDISQYQELKDDYIGLVCFNGRRALKVKTLLEKKGFNNVMLMDKQIVNLNERTESKSKIWTVDRQFRLALGLLIGFFLVGNYLFNSPYTVIILLIVFSGLTYSALSDSCYLKSLITILPWNKKLK